MAAVATALATLLTMAWAIGDYTGLRPVTKTEHMLVSSNQDAIAESLSQLQFSWLLQKQKDGVLDFVEHQQMCRLARDLDYFGVPGCPEFFGPPRIEKRGE